MAGNIELHRNDVSVSHWRQCKSEAESTKLCMGSSRTKMKVKTYICICIHIYVIYSKKIHILKKLKCFIRKYSLNAKESSKGGKDKQKKT